MDEQNKRPKNLLPTLIVMALVILLLVGVIGWMIGRSDNGDNTAQNAPTSDTTQAKPQASAGRVTDLVEFDVPGGWNQSSCEGAEDVVYFVPSSTTPDCAADPVFSITLAVDPQNNTDCNQLQDVRDVSKHICRSVFIDGRKTLEAQTIYNQDSSVLPGRTVDAYYINTGRGVVVARYIHTGDAGYGTVFNNLVQGLRVRG